MPATFPMQPQAALEAAVLAALHGRLGYTTATAGRAFDGQPPPRCGKVFAAVWSDGRRGSNSGESLHESFSVNVTLTVRCEQPFDRWLTHRDDLETRLNKIRAYVHGDRWDFRISNAANALCGYRNAGDHTTDQPAGFLGSLMFLGYDPIREVGADWFHADPTDARAAEKNMGFAQTARFGNAERVETMDNQALG
jgi:hypothetical protein